MQKKAIILLDDNTRQNMNYNISQFKDEYLIIKELKELEKNIITEVNKIIIFEWFIHNSINIIQLKVYKDIFNLNYYYFGSDEILINQIDDLCYITKCDVTLLQIGLIEKAIINDTLDKNDEKFVIPNLLALAKELKNSNDSKVVELANGYLNLRDNYSETIKTLAKFKETTRKVELENSAYVSTNNKLLNGLIQIVDKAIEQREKIQDFEAILVKNNDKKISINKYLNAPTIIYFTEYDHLIGQEKFIQVLYDIFRLQYSKSVKVLTLFDNATSKEMKKLPTYYTRFYNKYLESDIIANDFIAKSSNFDNLFKYLFHNNMALDILIVIDRTNTTDIKILGQPLIINICADKNYFNTFNLLQSNTISNGSSDEVDNTLTWYNYDINELPEDTEEQFLFLSSRKIFSDILELYNFYLTSI